MTPIRLELADGTSFNGISFGGEKSTAGEVVFNTGMVGYPEALTDPSYRGQILVLTYPLIGNYGVPADSFFESSQIQISGLIVSWVSEDYSHPHAVKSLSSWLKEYNIPAIAGIDTRKLTKKLREEGTMLGRIVCNRDEVELFDPDRHNLVLEVSPREVVTHKGGDKRVVLVDCGCKNNIIHSLKDRGCTVIQVPWDYDFSNMDFDGLLISNGPGNPKMCGAAISNIQKAMGFGRPILGICLGNQLLALAVGADTYKLKYGHRGQNQPCILNAGDRCFITSQNHGYAVENSTLPDEWTIWFANANDGTNEGIRHRSKPFMGVQFHPEANPGPTDTSFIFDEFVGMLR